MLSAETRRLRERHDAALQAVLAAGEDLRIAGEMKAAGTATMRSVNAKRRDFDESLERERALCFRAYPHDGVR